MAVSIAGDGTLTGIDPVLSGFGKVLQVVQTVKTDTFTSSSGTFTDVTGLTVTITPETASHKVLVLWSINIGGLNGYQQNGRLVRGATAIFAGGTSGSRTSGTNANFLGSDNDQRVWSGMYLDSPNTTSATTYGYQVRVSGGSNVYVNRNHTDTDAAGVPRSASSIIAIEVAA